MPPIRVKYVISFSSQAPKNTVEDLVKSRGSWLSDASDRTGRLQADIQLERATTISYIDLGNAGSVMVSIEVGHSSWPSNKPLVALLPTVALMTPAEWRAGKNSKTVRMFKKEDLDQDAVKEKWDRVRIICTQPFRKDAQFGLALFCLHTTDECHVQEEVTSVNPQRVPPKGTHSDLKKEELVSRMNLPTAQKKVMSQSIGWLENKVLTNGDEANASNPFTSPVSRAARLVVMATKPTSKENVASNKASLECEALDFLISLNLNIEEINSLKVSGVRQQFEQQRQKMLNHDEKIVFKDIALDYAKKRLESLEKRLEKSVQNDTWKNKNTTKKPQKQSKKEKENKFKGHIQQTTMNKDNKEEKRRTLTNTNMMQKEADKPANPPVRQHSHGKFTFKKIEAPGSSLALLKKSPVRRTEHQRSGNDLTTLSPSGLSRNELALSDATVTTPKRPRGRPKKSVTPKMADSKQPTVNTWITPVAKRKREEPHFSYSPQASQFSRELNEVNSGLIWSDSDDDISTVSVNKQEGGGFIDDVTPWTNANPQGRDITSTSSGNYLGSVPSDKFGVAQARKRSRGDSTDFTQSKASIKSHSSTMMECPLCSGFFHPSKIESHAASCGIVLSSDSDSESEDGYRSSNSNEQNKQRTSMEECPVCGNFINTSDLQEHAAECANSTFG